MAAGIAIDIATRLANGRANNRADNKIAEFTTNRANNWALSKTKKRDDIIHGEVAGLATSETNG